MIYDLRLITNENVYGDVGDDHGGLFHIPIGGHNIVYLIGHTFHYDIPKGGQNTVYLIGHTWKRVTLSTPVVSRIRIVFDECIGMYSKLLLVVYDHSFGLLH